MRSFSGALHCARRGGVTTAVQPQRLPAKLGLHSSRGQSSRSVALCRPCLRQVLVQILTETGQLQVISRIVPTLLCLTWAAVWLEGHLGPLSDAPAHLVVAAWIVKRVRAHSRTPPHAEPSLPPVLGDYWCCGAVPLRDCSGTSRVLALASWGFVPLPSSSCSERQHRLFSLPSVGARTSIGFR